MFLHLVCIGALEMFYDDDVDDDDEGTSWLFDLKTISWLRPKMV